MYDAYKKILNEDELQLIQELQVTNKPFFKVLTISLKEDSFDKGEYFLSENGRFSEDSNKGNKIDPLM